MCLDQSGTAGFLTPCSTSSQQWGLANDATNVHVGTVGATGTCLTVGPRVYAPSLAKCIYTGPLPPLDVTRPNFATQAFVWGTNGQIVAATNSMCLTAGLPNYDPNDTTHWTGVWKTNNGTLEHEVWMGDLTPKNNEPRRVVALFNKGNSTEQVFAPAELYMRDLGAVSGVRVRDVVNKKDVAVALGNSIVADVPTHGVAMFVVTFNK